MRLPLSEVVSVKAGVGFEAIRSAQPDVLAVVAYGEILPQPVLDLPRSAPVNVHFSLLPELRGAAPVQRAILEGLSVTGVTTIRMDEGMDSGPILLQAEEAVGDEDDADSLGERLAAIGGRLLVDTVDRLEAGSLVERPQDQAAATFAPKLSAEDRVVDWARPALEIVRLIRALSPDPGAEAMFRGRRLKIYRASIHHAPTVASLSPGVVVLVNGHLGVSAADSPPRLVILEEVAPEGRRRMRGEDFVRGYRPEQHQPLG